MRPRLYKTQWKREDFEKCSEIKGLYKDEYELSRTNNLPHFFVDYRFPILQGRLIELMEAKDGYRILDVGCGVGWLFFKILEFYPGIYLEYVGIDVSYDSIKRLHMLRKNENLNNMIGIVANAEHLPFREKSFDIIIATETLEHIKNPKYAIEQFAYVLKDNGAFILTTPSKAMTDFWSLLFYIPRKIKRLIESRPLALGLPVAYDYPLYACQLKKVLIKNNFRVETLEYNVFLPHESYLPFLPKPVLKILIGQAKFLDRWLRPFVNILGLHIIIRCRNIKKP